MPSVNRLNVALEVDGVSAILDLVADGAGSALLPPNAVFSSIKPSDFVTRRVEGAALDVPVMVATSGRRTMTSTQMAALALLCDTARVVLEGA
jgi:LysR family transcriptional regulator, nitrogen assimilation regulatory protein